jgi:H+-transporting ATPase
MKSTPSESTDIASKPLADFYSEMGSGPEGLTGADASQRLATYGLNVIEEKKVNPLTKFLGYFWGPIPWMIEIAALLSALIRHWTDLLIIIVLLIFNAVVGFWQEYQAANAIEALKKQLALKARVRRDGKWTEISAEDLVPGDVIRLRLGDIIPADVKLAEGDYLSIDQSALTGESLPVDKKPEDAGYSGSVVKRGEMIALVVSTGANTYFGKTAGLVSRAKPVSHFQRAVLTIGDYLIYLSLGLAATLVLTMLFRGSHFLSLLQFALILIVASIPVAMPAVLSVTMAIGALSLARMKAIVTRLESIEEMAGINILCCDKTGTLTQNRLTLGDPVLFEARDDQELILAAALASKEEDRDAIDMAVIGGLKDPKQPDAYRQVNFVPFDPVIKRTEAAVQGPDGASFKVTKGAPQVILELSNPDEKMAKEVNAKVDEYAGKGFRTLGVAKTGTGGEWLFLGLLPLFDPPREDSVETIRQAGELGVKIKMVTGDNISIAREISKQLGLGTNIHTATELFPGKGDQDAVRGIAGIVEAADGFAQVFPEHKFEIVKALQERGHIVGMTGDGVNDAPALKQADTGIAVSGATDAARAAAALVLTKPGLSVIVRAMEEARKIFERMNSYAIYRVIETIRIMFFVTLAMIAFNFYPITAVLIILLAVLNDLPILTIAYDNTWLEPKPVRWEMRRILAVSTVLGLIGVIETFGILVIAKLFLNLSIEQIQSFIFLKLAVAGHLTLFVARTKRSFLSPPYPAAALVGAVLFTKALAVAIVGFGIFVASIPWSSIGIVFGYCLVWVFIEDWAKLQVYQHLGFTGVRHRQFLDTIKAPIHRHAR